MFTKKFILIVSILFCATIARAQYSSYELSTLLFVARGESSMATPEDVANAQFEAGSRYYYGNGGAQKDLIKAHYWFLQSANGGNRYAQNVVGWNYYNGTGVAANKGEDVAWFEKSGLKHYHASSLQAGKMYYNGDGTSVDYYKAASMFKDAAFGEIPEGMYYYALCYAYGHGVQADSTKAVLWADRAIDKGYNWSYWLLGHMYAEGLAVTKDNWSAKFYFEEGASLNVSGCQNDLGVAYETGTFVEKDLGKAMDYYLSAANSGSTAAMSNLARIYSLKGNDLYNPSQAVVWYKKLIDTGGDNYIGRLIDLYEEIGNYRDAATLYEKQASNGSTTALNQLAYIYAQGKGVNKDFDKALSYIERAILLAPDDMNYQDSKGEILVMKGDIKKAKKVWKHINATQPYYYQERIKKDGEEPPFYSYMKANEK